MLLGKVNDQDLAQVQAAEIAAAGVREYDKTHSKVLACVIMEREWRDRQDNLVSPILTYIMAAEALSIYMN